MAEQINVPWGFGSFTNTFRTLGQKSVPTLVDLQSPISPVIDLSRLAQRGTYWTYNYAKDGLSSATVDRNAVSVKDELPGLNLGVPNLDIDAWLISPALFVSRNNFSTYTVFEVCFTPAGVGSESYVPVAGPQPPFLPHSYWSKGDMNEVDSLLVKAASPWYVIRLTNVVGAGVPYQVDVDAAESVLWAFWNTDQANAVSYRLNLLFWLGPRGATPPGRG